MSIDLLPDELLAACFAALSARSLTRAARACTRWRGIAGRNELWRALCSSRGPSTTRLKVLCHRTFYMQRARRQRPWRISDYTLLLDGELHWDKLEGAHWKQKHARRMVNSVNARKQAEATEQDIIDAVAGINFEKGGRYTNTEIKQALTDALAELGLEDLTVNAGILRKAFVISPTMITVNEYGERENGYIIRGRVDGADMEEAAPQEPVAELKTVEAQLCEDEELMAMVSSMSDAFDVPLLDPIW